MNVEQRTVMKVSESTFLLHLFSASATKPSTFTKLSVPWQETDRGSQRVEDEAVWAGAAQEAATSEQSLTSLPNPSAGCCQRKGLSLLEPSVCTLCLGSALAISSTRMNTLPPSLLLCRLCFLSDQWLHVAAMC